MTRDLSPNTLAVTLGRPAETAGAPVNHPISMSSTFVADGPVGYGRTDMESWQALESTVAALEKAAGAVSYSSGMAAASAVLDLVPVGGVVVVPDISYNGTLAETQHLHDSGRITMRRVPVGDIDAIREASAGADLIWIETPTNPTLTLTDLAAVADIAANVGATTVCDSTLASPLGQQPITHGIDIVMHSATKYIAGHSDLLMGMLLGDADRCRELRSRRALLGSIPGSFEAWLALRGVRTLPLRWNRAVETAALLAQRLSEHPKVETVHALSLPTDPGFGLAQRQMSSTTAVISIEVSGGSAAAERVCRSTEIWTHATSLGGVESLIERRRRWPSESPLVAPALIRLSVGVEDAEDLWADLDSALETA